MNYTLFSLQVLVDLLKLRYTCNKHKTKEQFKNRILSKTLKMVIRLISHGREMMKVSLVCESSETDVQYSTKYSKVYIFTHFLFYIFIMIKLNFRSMYQIGLVHIMACMYLTHSSYIIWDWSFTTMRGNIT